MEPLAPAVLAGLTPPDVQVRFYDDRLESIPFDEPADLVALSVETYTARRAYQIASEYRRRGVPVVMGGFHPTLVPEEAGEYAEAIVVGEAEGVWPEVLADCRGGQAAAGLPGPGPARPGRAAPGPLHLRRQALPAHRAGGGGAGLPLPLRVLRRAVLLRQHPDPAPGGGDPRRDPQVQRMGRKLIFFVDDNITSNMAQAKAFFRALIPLRIRWVSQASINAAHDEEFLRLLKASGCQGLLIGFESLNPDNLARMRKAFNTARGGYEVALANLRRHGIRLYVTFILGYDDDDGDTSRETLAFALRHRFYMVAFNHLTPFPGTPLYERLEREGRLLYDRWWLHPRYRYGMVPFAPRGAPRRRCAPAASRPAAPSTPGPPCSGAAWTSASTATASSCGPTSSSSTP